MLIVDSEGIEGQDLDELIEEYPAGRLIFLGLPADGERWLATRQGQAWGYLPRDAEELEIATAVRAVTANLVAMASLAWSCWRCR